MPKKPKHQKPANQPAPKRPGPVEATMPSGYSTTLPKPKGDAVHRGINVRG